MPREFTDAGKNEVKVIIALQWKLSPKTKKLFKE